MNAGPVHRSSIGNGGSVSGAKPLLEDATLTGQPPVRRTFLLT
jgi:hypothetical protein